MTSWIRVHSSVRRSQTFLCLLLQLQRVWRSLLDLLTSLFILCRETQSDSVTPAVIHVRNFTVKFVARFRWFLSFVNESMSKTFWWKHDQLFLPSVMSSLHFFLWMNTSLHFVSRFVYLQRLFTCVADTRPRLTESCFIEPGSFAQNRFYGNKPDFAFQFFEFLLMSKTRWKKPFWRFSYYYYFLTRFFFLNFLFLLRIVCCCFRVKRDILNIFSLSLLLLFSETKRGK